MPLSTHSERLMGTTITISLVDERADSLLQKSFDLLKELEYRFNANSQESELMEINYQSGRAPVKVQYWSLDSNLAYRFFRCQSCPTSRN